MEYEYGSIWSGHVWPHLNLVWTVWMNFRVWFVWPWMIETPAPRTRDSGAIEADGAGIAFGQRTREVESRKQVKLGTWLTPKHTCHV